MSTLGQEIREGLKDALAHASGEANTVRTTVIHAPDVRAIREDLHLSQSEFPRPTKSRLRPFKAGNRVGAIQIKQPLPI